MRQFSAISQASRRQKMSIQRSYGRQPPDISAANMQILQKLHSQLQQLQLFEHLALK
jgi:hypothetical protein